LRHSLYGCAVGSEHDVRIEHREKRVDVTAISKASRFVNV
jgi:hypothetical protein